jgi:hypothetical protein
MSVWKIDLLCDGHKQKHKFYDSEKSFNTYWKHHAEYADYFTNLSSRFSKQKYTLIGYKDGVEIRRHPSS